MSDHPPGSDQRALNNGTGLGCLCQVAAYFILASVWERAWPFWGFAAWIVVLPLALFLYRRGHRAIVKGMLIVGFIGMLLSSACAVISNTM